MQRNELNEVCSQQGQRESENMEGGKWQENSTLLRFSAKIYPVLKGGATNSQMTEEEISLSIT